MVLPNVEIGQEVRLRKVIVDKHCRVPDGLSAGLDPARDRERFLVTDNGVTVITPEMLGQRPHYFR